MKAILSDVHGNYPALRAVLDYLDNIACEEIILLGDIAGYYCMLNECITALRERKVVLAVMGNHDYYLTQNVRCSRSTIVNQCLEYQKKIILPEYVSWLKDFKIKYENNEISIVHGGWNDYIDEYLEVIDTRLFRDKKQSLFFSGHTHKQLYVKGNYFMYCNPGSVGQPRDNDWRASFAILLDSGEIELCRVEYDIEQIIFMMKRAGFEERSYINLYSGTRIGG